MGIEDTEAIRLRLELETKVAENAMKNAVSLIKTEAEKSKKSFAEIGEALKTAFVGTISDWNKYKTAVDSAVSSLQLAENSIERQIVATKTEVALMESLAAAAQKVTLTKLGESTLSAHAQQAGVTPGDVGVLGQALTQERIALNEIEAKSLANTAIAQDNLNRADAEALALINKINPQLNTRARAEEKVALATAKVAEAENYQTQTNAAEKVALATRKVADAERGLIDTSVPLTDAQKKLGQELKNLEPPANKAGKGLISFANFARTAFGTLTAIGIFQVLTTISKFFTGAIKAAQDFRAQLLLLNFSEAILSQKGMDITRAELDKFVSDVETKFKYLSKLQAMTIVSETAGATQEFGISKDQLGELTKAIAFIQLKNKMLGREDVDAAHIINAAMDARSNFFNGMGINITKSIVDQKAYNMGLAKAGEELSKDARFQAILALLVEQTSSKQAELNKQLEGTPLGNQMEMSKEWADTMLKVGTSLLSVKDSLIELWNIINSGGDATTAIITFFEELTDDTNDFIDAIHNYITVMDTFNKTVDALDGKSKKKDGGLLGRLLFGGLANDFLQSLVVALGTILATILAFLTTLSLELQAGFGADAWKDAWANAFQAWREGWERAKRVLSGEQGLFEPNPSPEKREYKESGFGTGNGVPTTGEVAKELETITAEMQEKLDKFNQEILEAELKLGQDLEDARIDWLRKLADITAEYNQKEADAYRDYTKKISDINRDFDSKIEDINRKQKEAKEKDRQDELEREREFQNKLQEMKEDFLMDLDDALHARDARQILRLIKQYNLDKLQAERKNELDKKSAEENAKIRQKAFEEERKQAEEERQLKLEEAQQDFNDKIAQLALDEALEVEAANLKYERELEDLNRHMHDRLEIIAGNLALEYATTVGWLDAIAAVYRAHFAEVSALYAAMNAMTSGTTPTSSPPSGGLENPGDGAAGGRLRKGDGTSVAPSFANHPTNATLGVGGFEMANFTPIGRTGRDVNKMFSSLGGGASSANGKVSIELLLSPDLESRIVSNTLSKTAEVVTRIRRSKG